MRCTIAVAVALSGWAAVAGADQAAYVSKDAADRAVTTLQGQNAIRAYCKPCGDTAYTVTPTYGDVQAVAVEGTSYYEVKVAGEGIDLAYVYVNEEGAWTNLALLLGVEVSDVPKTLGGDVIGPLPMLWPAGYAGTIGESPVIVWLSAYDTEIGGRYHYARVGIELDLSGSMKDARTFALEERAPAEDKPGDADLPSDGEDAPDPDLGPVTGKLEGRFVQDGAAIEGTWSSPDGAKSLPIKIARIALEANGNEGISLAGRYSECTSSYPVLLPAEDPWAKALNAAVQANLRRLMDGFQQDYITDWLPGYLPEALGAEPDSPTWDWSRDVTFTLQDHTPGFASLLIAYYDFTGGAHGNTFFEGLNLKREGSAAKPVELKDLFADFDAGIKACSTRCIADLEKQGADSVVSGAITAFKAGELHAYTIARGGITFHFPPYAAGPYAQGSFRVRVPWDALKPALNPGLPDALFKE